MIPLADIQIDLHNLLNVFPLKSLSNDGPSQQEIQTVLFVSAAKYLELGHEIKTG